MEIANLATNQDATLLDLWWFDGDLMVITIIIVILFCMTLEYTWIQQIHITYTWMHMIFSYCLY